MLFATNTYISNHIFETTMEEAEVGSVPSESQGRWETRVPTVSS